MRLGGIAIVIAICSSLAHAKRPSSLVLVGGALEDERIYEEIVKRAGGKGAKIGILTASSTPKDAPTNGAFYVDKLKALGAHAEWIPIDLDHIANNRDPALVAKIAGMSGFFFGGGDQSRYVKTLMQKRGKDSPVLAAIRRRFTSGGVVLAGTSAGTAAMVSGPMITGNRTSMKRGLGFFQGGILDTHFGERKREARLVKLATHKKQRTAYGIDEDTALVVDDALSRTPRMHVIGKGHVSVLDVSRRAYTKWGKNRSR